MKELLKLAFMASRAQVEDGTYTHGSFSVPNHVQRFTCFEDFLEHYKETISLQLLEKEARLFAEGLLGAGEDRSSGEALCRVCDVQDCLEDYLRCNLE